MRRAKMRIKLIERIKQLSSNIWNTNVNSEAILKEVTYTNDKLSELDKFNFTLINKENDNEKL